MLIELTAEEFELVETSLERRIETWYLTLKYLETGEAEGQIEECHKVSEARWVMLQHQVPPDQLMSNR
jgi:hypothetical protein